MGKKKRQEFLSDLFVYTETKEFEYMMIEYCREKRRDINNDFHEGCRAGFFLAMSMHFSSKNKKTSTFLKKWVKAMASADDRQLKSN
jgi:hypothetical protein